MKVAKPALDPELRFPAALRFPSPFPIECSVFQVNDGPRRTRFAAETRTEFLFSAQCENFWRVGHYPYLGGCYRLMRRATTITQNVPPGLGVDFQAGFISTENTRNCVREHLAGYMPQQWCYRRIPPQGRQYFGALTNRRTCGLQVGLYVAD